MSTYLGFCSQFFRQRFICSGPSFSRIACHLKKDCRYRERTKDTKSGVSFPGNLVSIMSGLKLNHAAAMSLASAVATNVLPVPEHPYKSIALGCGSLH